MNLAQSILQPITTEKSTRGNEQGQYVFLVPKNSTKLQVKEAIQTIYGATIVKINTLPTREKNRIGRNRRHSRKKQSYKKVIIFVKDKKALDLNKFIKEK